MDVGKAMAAAPVVRKVWRWIPPPLRIPLIVIGVVVWIWRRRQDDAGAEGDAHGSAA